MTRSASASQPSSARTNQAMPASTYSDVPVSASSSRHSVRARRAERVCQTSVPWPERIRRDSSPEVERSWPGVSASTSVTSQPAPASRCATEAPNTPAPTTIAEGTAASVYLGCMTTTDTRTVGSIVGGRTAADAPGGRVQSTNPARTGRERGRGAARATPTPSSRPAARLAPPRRNGPPCPRPVRGRAIQQVGRLVEANKEALARLVTQEIGKPYAESLGEVQEIVDTCDFFLGEGRRLYGQTVPERDARQAALHLPGAGRRGGDHHRRQLPGRRCRPGTSCRRCCAATRSCGSRPSTRPRSATRWRSSSCTAACPTACSTSCWPTASRRSPGLERALDEGLVDKVGFTGSSDVGREIGALCGRHLQSPCLELGGKNPLVVMDDAELDLAVEGALFRGFGTAGQRCTSLGTVIVQDTVHDEFMRALRRARSSRRRSATRPQDVLYGPMIAPALPPSASRTGSG